MSARYALFVSLLAALGACDREAEAPDEAMDPAALERSEEERRAADVERQAAEAERQAAEAERQAAEQRTPEQQPGAQPLTQQGAPQLIAQARCEREQRCGNVGPDKTYASQSACVERVRADWAEDLNARECPEGIVQDELAECLEEIRNEDCSSPFDTLGRITACRASDICNAAP